MHVEDRDAMERLQELAKHYRNTRTWPRLQAVILAKRGDTAPQIARALGFSRRAVQAWVAAYNRGGLEALPDRPRPGRTPLLPPDQEGRFLERIATPPSPEEGASEWRGSDIRRVLEQEFAARYSLSGVSKLLHRLGHNDLMPRPQHPEASPEARRRSPSRRSSSSRSRPSPPSTPAKRSRSGTRMRRVSASKGRSRGPGHAGARGRVGCVRTGGSRSTS